MMINLKEQCAKQTITREDRQRIADLIATAWDKEELITVDFETVN